MSEIPWVINIFGWNPVGYINTNGWNPVGDKKNGWNSRGSLCLLECQSRRFALLCSNVSWCRNRHPATLCLVWTFHRFVILSTWTSTGFDSNWQTLNGTHPERLRESETDKHIQTHTAPLAHTESLRQIKRDALTSWTTTSRHTPTTLYK